MNTKEEKVDVRRKKSKATEAMVNEAPWYGGPRCAGDLYMRVNSALVQRPTEIADITALGRR